MCAPTEWEIHTDLVPRAMMALHCPSRSRSGHRADSGNTSPASAWSHSWPRPLIERLRLAAVSPRSRRAFWMTPFGVRSEGSGTGKPMRAPDNIYWTNPLRGSGAASAAMASRGKARHSGRAWCQHARNRIVRQSLSATLVDRLSQPRVAADTQRCLQRFDSAADLKQTKPILARSTPYPHGLYPPHRVFHRSAGRHWPTFTTIAPWINSTAPADRVPRRGVRAWLVIALSGGAGRCISLPQRAS